MNPSPRPPQPVSSTEPSSTDPSSTSPPRRTSEGDGTKADASHRADGTARADVGHGVSGDLFRPLSHVRASAGRILGVGLLCFAIWTLVDANQLYNSALQGPDGVRRSVAVAILRPLSAVSNAIHISSLVTWGDSILGRGAGTLGQSQVSLKVPTIPVVEPLNHLLNGTTPLPHDETGTYVPPPINPQLSVPPLAAPTTAHPLTILDIGDSVGEDLGYGLGDVFTGDSYVNVVQKGAENTGLARPDYWNWPGHLEQDLQAYHPGVVVIMLGLNDDQNLNEKGTTAAAFCPDFGAQCAVVAGTQAWVRDYTARVSLLMNEALLAKAHVLWVGLPPVGGGNVTNGFCKQINAIDLEQAKLHPGVTFVSSWKVLSGPQGQYEAYLRINGSEEQVRSDDGIHLLPPGYDLLANSLVKPMQQAWKVNLHVRP